MLIEEELTSKTLGAALEVPKVLGPGLLESVYEESLCHELGLRALSTLVRKYDDVSSLPLPLPLALTSLLPSSSTSSTNRIGDGYGDHYGNGNGCHRSPYFRNEVLVPPAENGARVTAMR